MPRSPDPDRQELTEKGVDGGCVKSGLAGDYDASAVGYDAYWGPALSKLAEEFVEGLPLSDARAVLDVGAGSGSLLRLLPRRTDAVIVGIDRSHGMLTLGPADAPRAVMDAETIAFKDGSFDVVLAMFVLFHLPDPAAALREIRRILTTGGTVALTTWGEDDPDFPAFDIFDEVLDRHGAAEGRGLYTRYELSDTAHKCSSLLEMSGFEKVEVRSERMAHQWTVDDLIGFRTTVGYGRVRWESLDAEARSAVLEEGRAALAAVNSAEMVLRDEVIYSVGKAAG